MKKTKLLVAALLAVTVTASAGAFAACDSNTEHKCKDVCPECNKCLSDCTDEVCKDKCEGHESSATVDMTEGVYSRMMGTYELLIKFYDESTYYMQNETTGYRGKYEIKDEEIVCCKTKDDGSDYNTNDDPNTASWITCSKAIYFYQEDGVTPIDYIVNNSETSAHDATTKPASICYAYGTASNALAYNTETDEIQSFKGNYGSRSLSHTTQKDFTISDEKAIEQAKYMVTTLPNDAKAGAVESDYFLTLSQKGYSTNIPALSAWGIDEGKFTKTDDTTYTLTDTISSATATLTITATGATVKKGNDTVELVAWEEVASYAARLTNTTYGLTLSLNEDGTLVLKGNISITGTYEYDGEKIEITLDENTNGASVTACTLNDKSLSVTIAVTSPRSMSFELTGTVTGTLHAKTAKTLLEVESNEAVYGSLKMKLEMKDNCTFVLSVGGTEKVTGYWSLNTETRKISFTNVSAGTLSFTLADPAKITWTGKLSDTQETDDTYTFEFAAAKLGTLATATPEVSYQFSGTALSGNVTLNAYLYSNGTVKIEGTSARGTSTVTTGTWTRGQGFPTVTLEGDYTATVSGTSATNVKLTLHGDIGTGSAGDYELAIVTE